MLMMIEIFDFRTLPSLLFVQIVQTAEQYNGQNAKQCNGQCARQYGKLQILWLVVCFLWNFLEVRKLVW